MIAQDNKTTNDIIIFIDYPGFPDQHSTWGDIGYSTVQQPVNLSDEISEANNEFMEAFNTGDMNAVAQHYTEDGKLFPANSEIIAGRQNIEAFWSGAPEMGVKKVKLETTIAEGFGKVAILVYSKMVSYSHNDCVLLIKQNAAFFPYCPET